MEGVRDWAIARLKVARVGCQRGEGRKRPALSEQTIGMRGWAANHFKESRTGRHEGEGRKGVTLRVIELRSGFSPQTPFIRAGLHLSSVNVEEHEVLGLGQGSNSP